MTDQQMSLTEDEINEKLILIINDNNEDEPIIYVNRMKRRSTIAEFFNGDFKDICKKNNLSEEDATRIIISQNEKIYLGFYIGKVDLGLNKEGKNELSLSYLDYRTSMYIYYGLKSLKDVNKFKIIIFDEIYDYDIKKVVKEELEKSKGEQEIVICKRELNVNHKVSEKSPDNITRSYEKVIDIETDTTWKEMIKIEQRLYAEKDL